MSGLDTISSFFDRQLALLQIERNAEIEQNTLLLSNCSHKLLEQRGFALLNLSVVNMQVGMGGRNLIELGRPPAFSTDSILPAHTFRPGDLARIEAHSGSSKTIKNKKTPKSATTSASEASLEGVVYKQIAKLMIVNVLLGINSPTKPADINEMEFYDTSLNESQRKAVQFVLGSKELACIHGPPGTGKTHTLLEIIRQSLFPRGSGLPIEIVPAKKILVCGASNLSVDNILERLLLPPLAGMTQIRCTRIGHPARVRGSGSSLDATLDAQSSRSEQAALLKDVQTEISDSLLLIAGKAKTQKGRKPRGDERRKLWNDIKELRKEYRKREKGVVTSVLSEAQVVLATCHSAGGRVLDNVDFDLIIIDEATQALEASCWIPVVKGKKLILAGDPMQLPPTVLSRDARFKTPRNPKEALANAKKSSSDDLPIDSQLTSDSESGEDSQDETESSRPQAKNKVIALSLRPSRSLSTTLFKRLEQMHGPSIKRMLEVQYRMHEMICDFPSKMLYSSRLRSDKSVATHLLKDLENVTSDESEKSREILGAPIVFFDTSGCEYFEKSNEHEDEGSKCNENEAMLVKSWVDKLVGAGILPSQIAVITPYQAQVTLVSSILSASYGVELEVGTVDGMQGREKEAIIISLVRSNDKREVGFLKDKRRLNVAMTRARRHMCVIGDSSTVQHGGPFLKKWMTWLEDKADVYYGGLEEMQ
ncbi:hypothetical protein EW145_g1317 [Phellinidium pouzarii]|uniref:DNA helicase n=1 Tax=Phellinidium pouzarii TaxID=167371 RepID=A0A4S4LFJ1_9AGAM|nr:hypothetical protein EW145_g1317 [Phellinidium pouzarii]